MTTTFEVEHPRAIAGRFADKAQSAPDFSLRTPSTEAVHPNEAQNRMLNSFEESYLGPGEYRPFLRHGAAGRLAASYLTHDSENHNAFSFVEVVLDDEGSVERAQELDDALSIWADLDWSDVSSTRAGVSAVNRGVEPSSNQEYALHGIHTPGFDISIARTKGLDIEVLAVSTSAPVRVIRIELDVHAQPKAAHEFALDRTGYHSWSKLPARARNRISTDGIPPDPVS